MYYVDNKIISDEKAEQIKSKNHQIWNHFWSIPSDQRTRTDWEKLLDIQILVKLPDQSS